MAQHDNIYILVHKATSGNRSCREMRLVSNVLQCLTSDWDFLLRRCSTSDKVTSNRSANMLKRQRKLHVSGRGENLLIPNMKVPAFTPEWLGQDLPFTDFESYKGNPEQFRHLMTPGPSSSTSVTQQGFSESTHDSKHDEECCPESVYNTGCRVASHIWHAPSSTVLEPPQCQLSLAAMPLGFRQSQVSPNLRAKRDLVQKYALSPEQSIGLRKKMIAVLSCRHVLVKRRLREMLRGLRPMLKVTGNAATLCKSHQTARAHRAEPRGYPGEGFISLLDSCLYSTAQNFGKFQQKAGVSDPHPEVLSEPSMLVELAACSKNQSSTVRSHRCRTRLEHRVMLPVPCIAENEFSTHLSKILQRLHHVVVLRQCWHPRRASRELRVHGRGHWRLLIPASWSISIRNKFWRELNHLISGGAAGWSNWLEENILQGSDDRSHEMRLWCFGESAEALWNAIYLASKGRIVGAGMTWIDAEGKVFITMKRALGQIRLL